MNNKYDKPSRIISRTDQMQKPSQFDIQKYVKENFNKEVPKTESKTISRRDTASYRKTDASMEFGISPNMLRDIIIWTEILGKPVSKRRRMK